MYFAGQAIYSHCDGQTPLNYGLFAAVQDVRMLRPLWCADGGGPLFGCSYLPGTRGLLAAAGAANTICLFDPSGAMLNKHPDGEEGALDLEQHKAGVDVLLQTGLQPPRQLHAVATSEDGTCIAAAGADLDPVLVWT